MTQSPTCVERGIGSVQDAQYDDMNVEPADSDSDVTIFGHLIPCGHTHYKGCEPCGCREYRDVTERSQDEGVDVRTRSELSQFADQDTAPMPADPDTVTITISRKDWYWMLELASLRIDNDPLSTLEDEERMDRIAALEGEK